MVYGQQFCFPRDGIYNYSGITRLLTKGEYGDLVILRPGCRFLLSSHPAICKLPLSEVSWNLRMILIVYTFPCLDWQHWLLAFFYVVFLVFDDFIFNSILAIDKKYIHIMFFYLFCAPAYSMFVTKHRAFYKYRVFSIMTGISIALSLGTSLILVVMMNDNWWEELLGSIFRQRS